MKQYWGIKKDHPDSILFYRMGDFYEMFGEDAVVASKVMNIALTTRDKNSSNPMPMCGVPFHALQTYLSRMVNNGYKVAIAEQIEDPKVAKGVVKREVMRIVTPGVTLEPSMLDEKSFNFLAAISSSKTGYGLAVTDLSTGLFRVCEFVGDSALYDLLDELERTSPRQILVSERIEETNPALFQILAKEFSGCYDFVDTWQFGYDNAKQTILDQFSIKSLDAFGLESMKLATGATGAAIAYLRDTQKTSIIQITKVILHNPTDYMAIDPATSRNLELVKSIATEDVKSSLLSALDQTKTAMGARQLKEWTLRPLTLTKLINRRLDTVGWFYSNSELLENVRNYLSKIGDLNRISGRVVSTSSSPRDLSALGISLQPLPGLAGLIDSVKSDMGSMWYRQWDNIEDLADLLNRSIANEPPNYAREGGVIKKGYSKALDELRETQVASRELVLNLEKHERERLGLASLKIKFNKVYGYFIEVSRRQADSVPNEWIRKQTLVNTERFISPKLKELENEIQCAEEESTNLELKLYSVVCSKVVEQVPRVLFMAQVISEIDCISNLAHVARKSNYHRPIVNDDDVLDIRDGRHPVLEMIELSERFTPNDALLNPEQRRLSIVTGPNMAGKSTYIRQVAIITLMAQMGSFVPAKSAIVGVCDRIFTRVGAQDILQKGQSTFMVEMNETALILNNATSKSLIILDEIGRGTSTFDGISIAWAVAEYIYRIGARTLFASHYHELTELADSLDCVVNLSVAVRERNDKIMFLRKVIEGASDKSYGIQVARLAGLPLEVIERAGVILAKLEAKELDALGQPRLEAKSSKVADKDQRDLFIVRTSEVEEKIKELDINSITPTQALNKLAEFKKWLV